MPTATVPTKRFPWFVEQVVGARKIVVVNRLDELPPVATRDRAALQQLGVLSGALAPMVVEDRLVGVVTFASVQREQRWSPELVARLGLVAEVIGSALARLDTEGALRRTLAENERLRERLAAENAYLQEQVSEVYDFREIVGRSAVLRETLARVDQVAATDAAVLLLGETGTGKELLARAVHARSHRSQAPFIAVNCAALPATLIESELFGHEKGAFTGATQAKRGRFELADGGTLFLDEIGDLEPALQTRLLRVLQDGEFERLGSTVTRKVSVRVISATNRDIDRAAAEGGFRADLYYRLAVFPIEVPPLRQRREDIPLLVWHFIQSRQRALGRVFTRISPAAMARLVAYDWPGNVSELQNVIERSIILSPGPTLRIDAAFAPTAAARKGDSDAGSSAENLEGAERGHILRVLERCKWRIEGRGQAADALGLRPSTLRNRMKKLGIRRPAR